MNKKFLAAMLLLTMSLAAGCGSNSNTGSDATPAPTATTETAEATDNSFAPITVTHAFGTTVIEEKPQRIVTLFWGNQDTPLALGIVPIGMSAANFAVDETGIHPWVKDAYTNLGADAPIVFDDTDGIDYEAVNDCQPDVILCSYSGITEEDYKKLSEIAPVIAYPTDPFVISWREQTIMNAEGMGMGEEGKALVDQTDALIKEKVANYPNIAGKTAAFCWFDATDLGNFYIYLNADPRSDYLNDLGFTVPNSIKSNYADSKDFSITVSSENVDMFNDIDVIVTYGDENLLKAMQADPRLSTIPAIKNGAVVLLDSTDPFAASCNPSILSIPYEIDNYLKVLDEAAAKVK